MGIVTAISWTDHTWNPWRGCSKVSSGCEFCYMFREMARYKKHDPKKVTRCAPQTFNAPLSKKWAKPALVFTCSWGDFFHKDADEWRNDAWTIIRQTPHLTYQILTKRPERIVEHLPNDWGEGWRNVWLGTTTETQKCFDERVPHLLGVPAVVRFLSMEPLLEDVDIQLSTNATIRNGIHWVIVGGESGPNARQMDPIWAQRILMACKDYSIPFFFKQHSGQTKGLRHAMLYGREYKEMPEWR